MKTYKPKRYHTQEQIIHDIAKERARVARYLEQSGENDCTSEQAKKLQHLAYRIEESRIPFLVQKLAELNTPMFPAIDDGDPSVPAGKRRNKRTPPSHELQRPV